MSSNRVQYFIRNILQTSKLNREKFLKNKKNYNMTFIKNKNYNIINKRNFTSYSNLPNPNNKNNEYIIFMVVVAVLYQYGKYK